MSILKSKKLKIVLGILVLLVAVYFMGFKSKGSQVGPVEEERIPSLMRTGGSNTSSAPLYTQIRNLRDPFKDMEMNAWKLENLVTLKKKEVELLKATLEESKLRKAIKELGGNIEKPSIADGIKSDGTEKDNRPRLLAVAIGENSRKALIKFGSESYWITEGQAVKGLRLERVTDEWVSLSYRGKKYKIRRREG